MSGYHFGQIGASYAADRELHRRFGSFKVTPTFGFKKGQKTVEIPLESSQLAFVNAEGTLHNKADHPLLSNGKSTKIKCSLLVIKCCLV